MSFIERIIGTFTNPDKAMADVCKEPRWEEALLIVGLLAVFAALSGYMGSKHISFTGEIPGGVDASMMNTITMITTVVGGLLGPFITWIVATVILFLLAMAFGGEGKLTSLLTGIGYSFIVKIIFVIISMLLLTQAPYLAVEYSSNAAAIIQAQAPYTSSMFVIASSIVGLIGLLWSCLIGVFALKHCQKLSLKSAAIVMIIPLAIYIIITYGLMILSMIK